MYLHNKFLSLTNITQSGLVKLNFENRYFDANLTDLLKWDFLNANMSDESPNSSTKKSKHYHEMKSI